MTTYVEKDGTTVHTHNLTELQKCDLEIGSLRRALQGQVNLINNAQVQIAIINDALARQVALRVKLEKAEPYRGVNKFDADAKADFVPEIAPELNGENNDRN